jgi:hypothetical protein
MQLLASIWAFVQANPALVLLAWPIATALITALFGAAEKYADSHPRFHVFLAFVESAGFDARGTLAAIAKLLPKAPTGSGPAALLVAIGFSCCLVANTACTAQQANTIIHDVSPAGACIVNALAEGGASDPMVIVAECAGTTIADVVQVIEDLLANPAQTPDAGAVGVSAHDRYLREMLTKAHAILAAGKLAAAK